MVRDEEMTDEEVRERSKSQCGLKKLICCLPRRERTGCMHDNVRPFDLVLSDQKKGNDDDLG